MYFRIFRMSFLLILFQSSYADLPVKTNCNESMCKHSVNIKDSGFYIFSHSMALGSEAGLMDVSLELQKNRLEASKFYFGGKITSNERTTAFISFYLTEDSALDLQADDYTGRVNDLRVKIFEQYDSNDGHGLVDSTYKALRRNVTIEAGDVAQFESLPKGHYLLTVTGLDAGAEGKLGASISGMNIARKITMGNELSLSNEYGAFNGYIASYLDEGVYIVKSRFGLSKEKFRCDDGLLCAGASEPLLLVQKTTPDGTRDVVTSAKTIKQLNDASLSQGFIIEQMEASDYNTLITYSLKNPITNELKIVLYEKGDDTYTELYSYTPVENQIASVTDLSINANGEVIAYGFHSVTFGTTEPVSYAKLFIYDRAAQATTTIDTGTGCGSNCGESDGPIENISINANGRYIAYDPSFDFIKIYDRVDGRLESLEDLDFISADSLSLSKDASFIVFSSTSSEFIGSNTHIQKGIFMKSLTDAGEVTLISVLADGVPIEGFNHNPILGSNNSYVLFSSNADSVVSLYLYDRNKGYSEKIANVGRNSQYSIDNSGTKVIFSSFLDLTVPKLFDEFRLWSLDLSDNELLLKASYKGGSIRRPLLSADDRNLVFYASEKNSLGEEEQSQLFFLRMQSNQANMILGN